MVFYSAWDKGDSWRQETVWQEISRLRFAALEMTGEGETIVYHRGRKLLANGFLLDVGNGDSSRQETVCEWFPTRRGKWGFISTGNCLRMVSYSTWDNGDSWRQETICEWFPTRRGTKGIHSDRKLLANGFLFGVGRWCIIATGNCLRIVSYPA